MTAPPPPRHRPLVERRATRPAGVLFRFGPMVFGVILCFAIVAAAIAGSPPPGANFAGGVIPLPVGERAGLTRPYSPAAECAGCHREYYDEWRRSVMAYAGRSPLFLSLEAQIQEQGFRSARCPQGAGLLRRAPDAAQACFENGNLATGSGGEHWCVYCHVPADAVMGEAQAWAGPHRRPLSEIAPAATAESIGCDFCHTATRSSRPGDAYVGNDAWRSVDTGARHPFRAGDESGIANSGYHVEPGASARSGPSPGTVVVEPGAHAAGSLDGGGYLRTSEFCGTCHDVRLFGTDAHKAEELGGAPPERFKRLRNAYSEWRAVDWTQTPWAALGRPVTCQECHMSLYPGICVPLGVGEVATDDSCPPGQKFLAKAPGELPEGPWASNSPAVRRRTPHYLTGVDVPLAPDYVGHLDDPDLDASGLPRGFSYRRRQLLRSALRFAVGEGATFDGSTLRLPVTVENVGTGHNVPAGFSQEREIWVELVVTDASGREVYTAGVITDTDGDGREGDEDLRDKFFSAVQTDPDVLDFEGRPIGLFGAEIRDGPDVPRWTREGQSEDRFVGRGLVNFQNGFLRCVVCDGPPDPDGFCRDFRGDRHGRARDGRYDPDTGSCVDPATGARGHLIETYFPFSGLRPGLGVAKAHDGLIADRVLRPFRPVTYLHEISAGGMQSPFTVRARLRFRAFPPFLIRAFAGYEEAQLRRGRRARALVTPEMLDRLDVVDVRSATALVR